MICLVFLVCQVITLFEECQRLFLEMYINRPTWKPCLIVLFLAL